MYGITETTIHVTYHCLTGEEIINNDGSSTSESRFLKHGSIFWMRLCDLCLPGFMAKYM